MKKTVAYILAGVLTLLGFSSCASLRRARQERFEREQQIADSLVRDQYQRDSAEMARQMHILDSLRKIENRNILLYAVPNVPYGTVKEMSPREEAE